MKQCIEFKCYIKNTNVSNITNSPIVISKNLTLKILDSLDTLADSFQFPKQRRISLSYCVNTLLGSDLIFKVNVISDLTKSLVLNHNHWSSYHYIHIKPQKYSNCSKLDIKHPHLEKKCYIFKVKVNSYI